MSDVLVGGSRRPPLPRWLWVVGAAVLVAVLVVIGLTRHGSRGKSASAPPGSVSPTPSTSPTPPTSSTPPASPTPPDRSGTVPASGLPAAWPYAPGACGSTAYLPQLTLAQHYGEVHGTVLVGGAGLQEVTVGRPSPTKVAGASVEPGSRVSSLVAGPDAAYADIEPCDATSVRVGAMYRIVAGVAHALVVPATPSSSDGYQFLFGGAHHAWAAWYAPQVTPSAGVPFNPGPVLTPLDGGPAVTLPVSSYLVADTAAGLVVGVADPADPYAPPRIKLVDIATGAVVRTFVDGYPMAAQGRAVIVQGSGCSGSQTQHTCTLERFDLTTGKLTRGYPMPVGRTPMSDAVFSPDARLIAFELTRASPDPRFDTGHPGPPSDLAILHLDTGRLAIVPNLELAPKTSAGLTFDATGTSLLATVNQGDHGELLIWQEGMPAPALVTSLRGPLDSAPVLLAQR